MVKKNVCKINEDDNSYHFQTFCRACCGDHGQGIMLEIDNFGEYNHGFEHDIVITVYCSCDISAYYMSFWRRLKTAIKTILGMHVEVQSEILLDSESLRDYIDTLEAGHKKLLKLKKPPRK